MADLSYTVDVNTGPAQRNLDQLNKRVDKLNNTFAGLKSALAGLAIGSMVSNVIKLADSIQDVSDATGVAVQNILGFQQAVQLNGGTADQAQTSLQKLVQTIGEAAGGGKSAQKAFADVGISLNDLGTLSEQDLLSKTIQGLAKIDDASKRAVLTTELLGKGFRGINVQGVAGQLAAATQASANYATAVQQTAQLQDKLTMAFQKLQLSILTAIQPLVEFINKIDNDTIDRFITALVELAKILGVIYAAGVVFQRGMQLIMLVLEGVAKFTISLVGALLVLRVNFASLATTVVKTAETFSAWWRLTPRFAEFGGRIAALGELVRELGKRFAYVPGPLARFAGALIAIFAPIAKAVTGIYMLIDAVKKLSEGYTFTDIIDSWALSLENFVTEHLPLVAKGINAINKLLGKVPPSGFLSKEENDNDLQRLKNRAKTLQDINKQATKRETTPAGTLTQDLAKQVAQYKLLSQQQSRVTQALFDSLNFQRDAIGLTEDELELRSQLQQETDRYANAVQSLKDKQASLKAEMIGEKDADKLKLLNTEIVLINGALKQQEGLYELNKQKIQEEIPLIQGLRMVEQARKQDIENVTKAIETQISRQQQLGDMMISANDKLKEVQFAGAQQQRSPLEQQLASIQEEARKAALEAGRVFAASYEGMDLTSAQSEELANGLQQIADKYKLIATEQTNNLTASRTWEQGWKTAFDNYMDNATNAASRAGEVFGSITRNMESAINNFVETGKFSFKDFTRSIIQDLIKIELKAQATKLLGMIGGGGGIFSAIGSLLGFANGGTPPLNKPSIVGEQGPELFVPKSLGTVVPNDRLGGGGGPISAPITNNYITNNISAVDAKSVAQLFAENRKTLLGTVEMARKELPYNNR
jgi:lambda family phage tail tape measure protein